MNNKKTNEQGTYIGNKFSTNKPVFKQFKRADSNCSNNLIGGIAGVGMSYSCKMQMIDIINNNPTAIIMEPNGELSKLVLDKLNIENGFKE